MLAHRARGQNWRQLRAFVWRHLVRLVRYADGGAAECGAHGGGQYGTPCLGEFQKLAQRRVELRQLLQRVSKCVC